MSGVRDWDPTVPAVTGLMRLLRLRAKGRLDAVRREVAQRTLRPASFAPPARLDRHMQLSVARRHGWPVYDVCPPATPTVHLVYLHGGAYIREISPGHWRAVVRIARTAGAHVVVPIYPLAPHGTARDTVRIAADIAADVIAEHGSDAVVTLGESAGGGLTLAAAQHLRDRHHVQPRRLVLVAPWLDLTLDDPRITPIEPLDAMLDRDGLRLAGRMYAGELPLDTPEASPLHGELRGLAPITVFVGTHDLLNPDAHALAQRAKDANLSVELIEQPGGQHVYPFLPTLTGRRARRQLIEEITRPQGQS